MVPRIGVVTGGGDCPGLNAVIRAVAKAAIRRGWKPIGIVGGYEGLLPTQQTKVLEGEILDGLLVRGGTILGTANQGKFSAKVGHGESRKLPTELLDELRDQRPTGTIRTPDSLAYDLRFAQQVPTAEGGRRIVLATDRPMGFWEVSRRPPTIDYPFTVIQMEINRDGEGKGTLSYATKITAMHNIIELENFATSPVMLTEIRTTKSHR